MRFAEPICATALKLAVAARCVMILETQNCMVSMEPLGIINALLSIKAGVRCECVAVIPKRQTSNITVVAASPSASDGTASLRSLRTWGSDH